jgi:hypothetical protein
MNLAVPPPLISLPVATHGCGLFPVHTAKIPSYQAPKIVVAPKPVAKAKLQENLPKRSRSNLRTKLATA